MLKIIDTNAEETKEMSCSLEDVGLEMVKIIGVSFFDDIHINRKVFQKSNKNAFDQEQVTQAKFYMFASSSLEKDAKKKAFVMTETGLYKIKVELKPSEF